MSLLLLFWSSSAFAANCPAPVSIESLGQLLTDAEDAYKRMDDAFPEVAQKVVDALPCMEDIIPTDTAARLHRELGLQELFAQRKDRAQQAFAASRTIQTYYVFPEDFIPPEHPARVAFEALSTESTATIPLPSPKEGGIRLDGEINLNRPTSWPTLFQQVDPTGKVVQTAYLWPEDAPPPYPVSSKKDQRQAGRSGGISPLPVATGMLSSGLLAAGLSLWITGQQDYGSELCDETSSTFNGPYCNEGPRVRIGVGRILTVVGAVGLGASGVWMAVSPSSVTVGGTF